MKNSILTIIVFAGLFTFCLLETQSDVNTSSDINVKQSCSGDNDCKGFQLENRDSRKRSLRSNV